MKKQSIEITTLSCEGKFLYVSYEGLEHPAKYDILDIRVPEIVERMVDNNYFPGQIKKCLEEKGLIQKHLSASDFLDNLLEAM